MDKGMAVHEVSVTEKVEKIGSLGIEFFDAKHEVKKLLEEVGAMVIACGNWLEGNGDPAWEDNKKFMGFEDAAMSLEIVLEDLELSGKILPPWTHVLAVEVTTNHKDSMCRDLRIGNAASRLQAVVDTLDKQPDNEGNMISLISSIRESISGLRSIEFTTF